MYHVAVQRTFTILNQLYHDTLTVVTFRKTRRIRRKPILGKQGQLVLNFSFKDFGQCWENRHWPIVLAKGYFSCTPASPVPIIYAHWEILNAQITYLIGSVTDYTIYQLLV